MARIEHHRSTRQYPSAPAGILPRPACAQRLVSGRLLDLRRLPRPVKDRRRRFAGPVQPHHQHEPPFGAGSQFDSLSLPGDSFWT